MVKTVFPSFSNLDTAQIYINRILPNGIYKLIRAAQQFNEVNKLPEPFIYNKMVNIKLTKDGEPIPITEESDLHDTLTMQQWDYASLPAKCPMSLDNTNTNMNNNLNLCNDNYVSSFNVNILLTHFNQVVRD